MNCQIEISDGARALVIQINNQRLYDDTLFNVNFDETHTPPPPQTH